MWLTAYAFTLLGYSIWHLIGSVCIFRVLIPILISHCSQWTSYHISFHIDLMAEEEGFEPSHPFRSNALAVRPLQPLEYSSVNKWVYTLTRGVCIGLVRVTSLELARYCYHRGLNPMCLPIPPHPHINKWYWAKGLSPLGTVVGFRVRDHLPTVCSDHYSTNYSLFIYTVFSYLCTFKRFSFWSMPQESNLNFHPY